MTSFAHPVPAPYRQPWFGGPDPRMRRALTVAGSIGLLFLLVVLISPSPTLHEKEVEELPERFARLILDEPPAPTTPAPATPRPNVEIESPEVVTPDPVRETPTPPPPRAERRTPVREQPKVAPDRGTAGRERARAEVEGQLAAVGAGVDEALESLAAVLPATGEGDDGTAAPRRRGGRVRAGRGAEATAGTEARATAGAGDLRAGAVEAGTTDLGTLATFDLAGVTGSDSAPAPGPSAGSAGDRSAQTLMEVVRRHAAGIRFCYDSALESDPSLRGKMVFRLTVDPSGRVTGVTVTEDTLRSDAVRGCALAQIEAWRFPTAATASTFDAPFVFRPTD